MPARIRSTVNSINPVDEASRDDLVVSDVVTLSSLDTEGSYFWKLEYAPAGSTAVFSGTATNNSPGNFTVDLVGPYLVSLQVNGGRSAGSIQYVLLRAATTSGMLLPAAGEGTVGTSTIPVDFTAESLTDANNTNLLLLEAQIAAIPGTAIVVNQNSHGFAAKDLIYYTGTAWAKSKADAVSTAEVDGMVVSTNGANQFSYNQPWRNLSIFSGLTAGSTYYLSPNTAGGMTVTPPTTSGQVSKPVLRALSTTSGIFVGLRGVQIGAGSTVQEITSSPYTVLAGDGVILVKMASAVATVNLPAGATSISKQVVVKDKSGLAGTYNITVVPNGAETIDGTTSAIIRVNYGAATFQFNGTEWSII